MAVSDSSWKKSGNGGPSWALESVHTLESASEVQRVDIVKESGEA